MASERISFTYNEIHLLWYLLSEAREGWDEDASEDELELADAVTEKVRVALAAVRRKEG